MADGDRLSILKDLLIKSVVNSPVEKILEFIASQMNSSSADPDEERDDTFMGQLLSKIAVLKKNIKCNNTLLHVFAMDGTVDTVSQLLKYGADVNAKNETGKTPMFYAIRNSVEMVKLLLDDSEVNDWFLFRQTLLYGTEEMPGLLLRKSLLEVQNDSTNKKIDEFPNTETWINAFLQHQLNIEESYPFLIFFAARISRKDILHTILDDCRKNWESIKRKQIRENIVKYMINYEPRAPKELNVQGHLHETGLHHAVMHQHVEAVRFLLEEGADPNCQDRRKFTPLHMASCLQNGEICQLLLSFGANVNPNFGFPPNPLSIVCGISKRDYSKYLSNYKVETEHCYDRDPVFNPEMMKLLLRNGANTESHSEAETPVLLMACEHGQVEEVKILLEYGANIRAVDFLKNSALHYAAKGSRSLEIVDFLLEKIFDIDLKNNENSTPFMVAVKNSLDMTEYLVDHGANINAMNVHGGTVLYYAIIDYDVFDGAVEFLLESGADWSILNIDETEISFTGNFSINRKEEILISFIALRENDLNDLIKFYVGKENRNANGNLREAFNYFQESKLEITKLKSTTIAKDVKKSYFDFLTKDFYTSVQIARNTDLEMFFYSDDYKNEFPCYERLLKNRFQMTQALDNFVDQTFSFISKYTNLPPEIVEVIMSNLCAKDFRIFGRVLLNKRF